METKSNKKIRQRILASLMSFLMVVSLIPVSSLQVIAAAGDGENRQKDNSPVYQAENNEETEEPEKNDFNSVIEPLDIIYDEMEHDAVNVTVEDTEKDTVFYKIDGEEWSKNIPPIKYPGEYTIYIKITREGEASAYETNVTAKIAKADIKDIIVNAYKGEYDKNSHAAVDVTGQREGDIITYICNGEETKEPPVMDKVEKKTVTVKVEREYYNIYMQDYTAEVEMGKIEGVTAKLKEDLTYTGNPQELVESIDGREEGDVVYYKVNDEAWTEEPAVGKEAGIYTVHIKVARGANYEEKEIELDPATVEIKKRSQDIAFINNNETEVEFGADGTTEIQFDYSVKGGLTDTPEFSYKVENDSESDETDISEIAEITDTGILTVKKGGYNIKVTATVAGDDNNKAADMEQHITIKNTESDLLSFENPSMAWSIGNSVVSEQEAEKKYGDDNGILSYTAKIAESESELKEYGLTIGEFSGKIEVTDIEKLESALKEKNTLVLQVTAEKTEGTKKRNGSEEKPTVYAQSQADYQVVIGYGETPENAYTLRNAENEIMTPSGQGWYDTAVTVVPADGYSIAKKITDEFGESVVFREEGSQEAIVYLKNNETGEISAPVNIGILRIDTVAPDVNKIEIKYPDSVNDKGAYYQENLKVTFTADDETSGIQKFVWKYVREDGASETNLALDEGEAEAEKVKDKDSEYTATITLPVKAEDQLRGYLEVAVVDNAGNESAYKSDQGTIFVRDTIPPTAEVMHDLENGIGKKNNDGDKYYYSGNVEWTFTITEANFYPEDVELSIMKDGEEAEKQILTWNKTENANEYEAKKLMTEEGEYVVSLKYTDRSQNEGEVTYKPTVVENQNFATIVIDKTAPVVGFSYDEETQTATVKVTEQNFDKKDIEVQTVAKTIKEDSVSCDLQAYLRNCDWEKSQDEYNRDVYTATISDAFANANYELKINYKDLALNDAKEVASRFTVDHEKPSVDKISVEYDKSTLKNVVYNILNHITMGKYFTPAVTIKVTAYDEISGIDSILWEYKKEESASSINVESLSGKVSEIEQDEKDKSKFTAVLRDIPLDEAQQLSGYFSFVAVDRKGNSSDKLTDTNQVIIVDTINPKASVDFGVSDNRDEETKKSYYKDDLTATFTINETNFFKEDVKIKLVKDGGEPVDIIPEWTNPEEDIYIGTYTIEAAENHANDGEYTFLVSYQDKTENNMDLDDPDGNWSETEKNVYQSEVKVIDTIRPEIDFHYYDYADEDNPQSAKIEIDEHNFNQKDIVVKTKAQNIKEQDIDKSIVADLQEYLRECEWIQDGDVYTAVIPQEQFTDAIYSLEIDYSDMAANSADTKTVTFTVDHTKPVLDETSFSYPQKPVTEIVQDTNPAGSVTYEYYGETAVVTFTAYDNTSGVAYFLWEYYREEKVSNINVGKYADNAPVTAVRDKEDKSKYTASVELPLEAADQLRGNIKVKAVDRYDNETQWITDSNHVLVRDTVSPVMTVEYSEPDNVKGSKLYYTQNITVTFRVEEANFYSEDMKIKLSRNGGDVADITPEWVDVSEDVHIGTYTIEALPDHSSDGDYVISVVDYHDRSETGIINYTSDILVVDTINPEIKFSYDNTPDVQAAVLTVTEHNFNKDDLTIDVEAEDIKGNKIDVDLQTYLTGSAEWTSEGDVHTARISSEFADAIYSVKLNYTDLSTRKAEQVSSTFTVDHTKPEVSSWSVSYSTPVLGTIISNITFGYYNLDVTVTFTAYDQTSGVSYFTWDYARQDGASGSNVAGYTGQRTEAVQDAADKSKFTASVKLPLSSAQQLRGNIAVTATDKFTNLSEKITDSGHCIVVDTISPTMTAEYTETSRTVGNRMYYNKPVTAVFTVNEANFYSTDVQTTVTKDGRATTISPQWTDVSTDVHVGRFTIDAPADHSNDGDYVVTVAYTDRSNNSMRTYTSDTLVIDTTAPELNVSYQNTDVINRLPDSAGNTRDYYNATQTAVLTVNEHNFNASEVSFSIGAYDIAGNALDVNTVSSMSGWTDNGDLHTMTITYPGDANYAFDIAYTDLAQNEAVDYEEDYFTVDTGKADNMMISYRTGVMDTILETITFGFYNAKTTVTITANDQISGVYSFKYSYLNTAGVSQANAQLADQIINEADITYSDDGAAATAVFEIPQDILNSNNQFNGTINFNATDRSGNESDYLQDTKRIVVDNISPTAEIVYNAPVQTIGTVAYYDKDVTATITMNEANFYSEDVQISVTRGGSAYNVSPSWTDASADVHTGTFTLSGDGDYFVTISYTDKSGNQMQTYTSSQLTIDTQITEASITANGQDIDGKAFKDDIVPEVSFNDTNFESYEIKLVRTSYADKNVDVTEKFITQAIQTNENGGSGKFDTFTKEQENDGIYTMTVSLKDKSGHSIDKTATFTVNRYGSVYEYNDSLISLISDGGAYVQSVDEDLQITEYNADRLVEKSLDIEVSRDGKPLEQVDYTVTPEINDVADKGDSGWYQYQYTIAKSNFAKDGVYKISVSSKDNTGNTPENTNYDDKDILFRVDSTAPEINSVSGLENPIINATEVNVKYTVYDTIGLKSVEVFVDGKSVEKITDFKNDLNNYSGTFTLAESKTAQQVRLVAYDLAGNDIDTDSDSFSSAYKFNQSVTVSTNVFVRWYADKALFWGSIAAVVVVAGAAAGIIIIRKKGKKSQAEE